MKIPFTLLASSAAAVSALTTTSTTLAAAQATSAVTNIDLVPVTHPGLDQKNLDNVKARNEVQLQYDSNTDPSVDSHVATFSVKDSHLPVVQLENSAYVKEVTCTDTSATVVFSDNAAFQAAFQDWRSHPEFVMVTFSPTCGSQYANNKREFVLIKGVSMVSREMTIKANIEIVDIFNAFGKSTLMTTQFGQYAAPKAIGARDQDLTSTHAFQWSEYPTDKLTTTKWGSGYQLYNDDSLSVACIGCGTKGGVSLTGTFTWNFFGVKEATLAAKGKMEATMQVGLDAQGVQATVPVGDVEILSMPLGAINIPGLLNIGPEISANVGGAFTANAAGSLLLGGHLEWPELSALANFHNQTAWAAGYTPLVTPVTDFNAKVSVALNAHLPLRLGISVDLVEGWWTQRSGFLDTPGFKLESSYATDDDCKGLHHKGKFINDCQMEVMGTPRELNTWSGSVYDVCQAVPGVPTPSTSTPVVNPPVGTSPSTIDTTQPMSSTTAAAPVQSTTTAAPAWSPSPQPSPAVRKPHGHGRKAHMKHQAASKAVKMTRGRRASKQA